MSIPPELPTRPELPEGWYYPDPDDTQQLLAELQRELPSGHLLYGVAVEVFAWREHATDDVLFRHRHQPEHFHRHPPFMVRPHRNQRPASHCRVRWFVG